MQTSIRLARCAAVGGLALACASTSSPARAGEAPARPRVIVSSDLPPLDVIPGKGARVGDPPEKISDPDDIQSMVRFLLYANEMDVEGLVVSAGTFANVARKQHVLDLLDVYGRVVGNLQRHDPRYPGVDRLRAVDLAGSRRRLGHARLRHRDPDAREHPRRGQGQRGLGRDHPHRRPARPPAGVVLRVGRLARGGPGDLDGTGHAQPGGARALPGQAAPLPDRAAGPDRAVDARLVPGPVRDPDPEELRGDVLELAGLRSEARRCGLGRRARSRRGTARSARRIRAAAGIRSPRECRKGTRPRSSTW